MIGEILINVACLSKDVRDPKTVYQDPTWSVMMLLEPLSLRQNRGKENWSIVVAC